MATVAKEEGGVVVLSLDFETTGLSTARDRIVEAAVVKQYADGRRERWSSLVNPTIPIPLHVVAIHGITDEMVKNSKTFKQIAPDLLAFLKTNSKATLCGHNLIRYDLPLLQAELVRAGLKPLDISQFHLVDSLIIFRKMEPHTLTKAVEFYCDGATLKDAHRASGDAEAALDVYLAQTQHYAHILGTDHKSIAQFCNQTSNTSNTSNFTFPKPPLPKTANDEKTSAKS
jgi:DNA polymerase III subunit epsilon